MSDNLESAATPAEGASAPKKRAGGLSTMLLADLKSMASGLGVAGASSMKKAQLIDAIEGQALRAALGMEEGELDALLIHLLGEMS